MAMVVVDASCLKQADSQPKSGGWSEGRRPLGAALHSPGEPSELLQWPQLWWQHYKYRRGYYDFFLPTSTIIINFDDPE